LIWEGIPRRPKTCGNEPRVEVTCEVCGDQVMRPAARQSRAVTGFAAGKDAAWLA